MKRKKPAKTTSASSETTSTTSDKHLHADKRLLIDADNVSVRLSGDLAIDQVSVCIHSGEFIGLIGPNGAGKTTLLRTLLGLITPTTGVIHRERAAYDYIPQRGNVYSGLTPLSVLEVVLLGSRGDRTKAHQALKAVHIDGLAQRRFNELSGGQQQRVAIAKALAASAEVLILDEPTTGIDERSQVEFYDILRTLQAQGITIIMVSHEVDAVLRLVTRVICLNRTILYDGSPEHFEADKYLPAVYKHQHRQLHHHHGEPEEHYV
jgi:zinc transport system ATP-binding protein